MGADKFEDLIAWQKARELTKEVYQVTRKDMFTKDFGLAGQIQRASVSIMSNIAEGFDRSNPNEFNHFVIIAKASCAEVRSQLYIAFDIGYLTQLEFNELLIQTQEVSRIPGGLRASLERQRKRKA